VVARWQPDARGRLLRAALDLFTERGYDATTAAQIAERAGLTKTTLFRHFADKREILFQGQETLVALAASAVAEAPRDASPFELLDAGVRALCSIHADDQREIGRQLNPLIAESAELRERAIFKRAAITDALRSALAARLDDPRLASVLADAGIRAYYDGFDAWVESTDDVPLEHVVLRELAAYEPLLPASAD